MTIIRQRPDKMQRAIKAALDAGLAAQITAINADLAVEESVESTPTWRLPSVPTASIVVVAQGEIAVEGDELAALSPHIRIAPQQRTHTPQSIGKKGSQTLTYRVHTFLSVDDVGTDEDEAALMGAVAALNDAIHWTLTEGLPGTPGYQGIAQVVDDARMHSNVDADDPEGSPVITVGVEGRMTITVRMRRAWRR